jgi:hypothetical protein
MRHAAEAICVTEAKCLSSPRILRNDTIRAIEQAGLGEPRGFQYWNPRHSGLRCTKIRELVGKADCEIAGQTITPETWEAGLGDGTHEGCPGSLTTHDLARQGISFRMIINCESGGSHYNRALTGAETLEML